MRRLWQGLMNGLLALMMLRVGAPTVAQPEAAALAASGVYTEDFSTYAAKDYVDNAIWDIWNRNLTVSLQDQLDIFPSSLKVASDRLGGAYVVWLNRQNTYIFQHIDSRGNTLWKEDQVSLINRYGVLVASYFNGDALLVWSESSSTFAQRYTPTGQPVWAAPIYLPETNNISNMSINANEYAVVVWRDSSLNYIYALKIDGAGNKLGGANRVNANFYPDYSLDDPEVSVNSDGSVYVAWGDYQSSGFRSIHLQYLNELGQRVWENDLIVNSPTILGSHVYPQVVSLPDNSVFVAWLDQFTSCVRGQRVDNTGNLHWGTLGICVNEAGTHVPSIPDAGYGEGSIFVTWWGNKGSTVARFVQRLTTTGQKLWLEDKPVDSSESGSPATDYWGPLIVVDHSNVPIVMWLDPIFDDYDNTYDVRANSLDNTGSRRWSVDARIDMPTGVVAQQSPDISVGVNGTTLFVWQDYRLSYTTVYAQRLDANGNRLWAQDVKVSADSRTNQSQPYVVVNATDQAYVVWSVTQGELKGTYLQLLDAWGNRVWTEDVFVTSAPGGRIALFADGSVAVAWVSDVSSGSQNVYMQRYSNTGNSLWNVPLQVNNQYAGKNGSYYFALTSMSHDAVALVWQNQIDANSSNLYAQITNSDGVKSWITDALVNKDLICGGSKKGIGLDSDPFGYLVIAWGGDERNPTYYGDIYAQRLDLNGIRQWNDDIRINSDFQTYSWVKQNSPQVLLDAQGNALIVWGYSTLGGSLYGQYVTPSGQKLWASDAHLINCGSRRRYELNFGLGMDWLTSNDIIIVWEDLKDGNSDIHAQRITDQGVVVWSPERKVVFPDRFYHGRGLAESTILDTTNENIRQATFVADYTLHGGMLDFYLTNDRGAHWASVTPGLTHVFSTTGSDLRWRIVLYADSVWPRTPTVNSLRIEYNSDAPGRDAYEPDDTCSQAQPLQVNGAAQRHTFHQYQDSDWGWFDAQAGTPYLIQTGNTGARADTVLELYDSCGNSPIDEDDNAFGPGATLTFTAPASGRYYVRVLQVDGGVYGAETEYDLSVRAQQPTGAAIIVAGRLNANDPVQPIINATADLAYQTLLRRGFAAGDIYYLNSDTTQPGVDGMPTKAQLRDAVQDWARPRVGLGAPLWLFLADHGNVDRFHNEIAEVVTAEELNLWLSNLEATSGVDQINVILDACFSGSFIDTQQNGDWGAQEISGHGRVVVASTTSRWWAYAPPIVGGRPTPVMYFSGGFWRALGEGQTLWHAFLTGREEVEGVPIGKCGDYAYTCQRPWLDDTGDAWFDTSDGLIAQSRGLATAFAGEIAPYIDWVEVGEIQNGRATLRAQVRDDGSVTRVWARVFAPSFTLPTSTDGSVPVISVPEAMLTRSVGDVFMVEYAGFTEPGAYQVVLYALDDEGHTSAPRAVLVGAQKVYLPLVIRQ
mgnify:FL=1